MGKSIAWVFFDVGNTLLHDDLAMVQVYRMLYEAISAEHPSVTFRDVLAMREHSIATRKDNQPHWTIGIEYFGLDGWVALRRHILDELDRNYERYHGPTPGVREALEALSSRYRLGVAGNQVKASRRALERFGLLQYMSLVWISEEIGLHKPDPEFYAAALREIGCPAAAAVMVGDRLDYDIRVPQSLGMKAIQARFAFESSIVPQDEFTRLYIESLGRARVAEIKPSDPIETPDRVITSFDQLPEAVASLEERTGGGCV